MPTLAQLAAEFELLIIPHLVHLHDLGKKRLMDVSQYFRALDGIVPHLVHLHDLGKKRLMDVSQYFRALDGIVQSSKQILAPSACWPLIFPLLS
jgi:hypothetical protein